MRTILFAFSVFFALTACSLTASLLGGTRYEVPYRDLRGHEQTLVVSFRIEERVIEDIDFAITAGGQERAEQLAAEANARALFIGKKVEEVDIPSSLGNEAQRPITEALGKALERLREDL